MKKTSAWYIFLGLLVGGLLGAGFGVFLENPFSGMQLGASAGLFIGWILVSAALRE